MIDPRQTAAALLGEIDWQNDVSGFCRCPGEALHTHKTGKKDCRVCIDGAPTCWCFHSSCAPAVAAANRRLRQELGAGNWEIALPGGRVLRSGDILQQDGAVKTREVIQGERRARSDAPYHADERIILESVRVMAERFRPELFEKFHWPFAQILEDSPLLVANRDPEDQFRTWLRLWPAHCHVWIGDVYSSGLPKHATHFRPVADWYQIGPVMGNYTCGSAFKPGSFRRSNENLNGQRFMVVESDTLTEVRAAPAHRGNECTMCVVSGPGRKVRPQARRHEHRQPSRSSVPTRSEAAANVAGSAGGAHGVTRPTFSESPALDCSGMMAGSGERAAETAGRAGPVPGYRTKMGVQRVLPVS